MKLLVDAHIFDGRFQGSRTYIEGLYTHMTHHQDIEFFFAAQNIENLKKVFGIADNIHYVQLKGENRLKRLIFDFPKIIKKYDVDYAHFQYISPLLRTCKEIVTIHDLLFLDFPQYFPVSYKIKNKFLFKRSAKRADVLLTVSEFSKDELVRCFRIGREKIHITYNSILPINQSIEDVNVKERFALTKYILTVSRIEPRKNYLLLLKAFVELNLFSQGYKLVIVGGQDLQYEEFFNYYDSLDKTQKDNILFLQVSFQEIVALYKNASLFVFPSLAEGFGIPPIEAIAYGCPLLCSNATAMAEFNLPEEISFNPSNLGELKQKMMQQLVSPMNPIVYKEKVLSMYNWQQIADGFYEVIMENYNKRK